MTLKETKTVDTVDGKLKVINGFNCKAENRIISLGILEDESIVISINRFKESEDKPYIEAITSQHIRLTKLTFALLCSCLMKATIDFKIDIDVIINELNKKEKGL
jgi:hypothetical protein